MHTPSCNWNRNLAIVPMPDSYLQAQKGTLPRRLVGLLAGCALMSVAGLSSAEEAPSAAEIDWRPKSQLPDAVRHSLPAFCAGGYLPLGSEEGSSGVFGETAVEAAALQASGLSARYEIDQELYLQGDVQVRQGSFRVSGSEARYNQNIGQLSIEGPLVSRGNGFLLTDRKSTRLNSSHVRISYAVFCLKKKINLDELSPRVLDVVDG